MSVYFLKVDMSSLHSVMTVSKFNSKSLFFTILLWLSPFILFLFVLWACYLGKYYYSIWDCVTYSSLWSLIRFLCSSLDNYIYTILSTICTKYKSSKYIYYISLINIKFTYLCFLSKLSSILIVSQISSAWRNASGNHVKQIGLKSPTLGIDRRLQLD